MEATKINSLINSVEDKVETRVGDLFEPVLGEMFNLIIFSPPYIPKKPRNLLEAAWRGGLKLECIRKFISEVSKYLDKKGRIQIAYSSLGNIFFLINGLEKAGFQVKILYKLKLPFEVIVILEGIKQS